MIITSSEIQQIYMNVYPDMERHYAMPFSEEFFVFKKFQYAMDLIIKHSVSGTTHIKNIRDCEKRAWKVHADAQWDRGLMAEQLSEEERYTATIGWLTGKTRFGIDHTIITTYSEDRGIVNIDPLLDRVEEVNLHKFNALLLVM